MSYLASSSINPGWQMRAVPGASQGGEPVPFPLAAAMIISALAAGGSAVAQSVSSRRQSRDQRALSEQELGLRESELNPYRHANAQMRSLMALDRAARTTPRTIGADEHGYSRVQGGDYTMTPEMVQWLTELRNRIAHGGAANAAITDRYRSRGNRPQNLAWNSTRGY